MSFEELMADASTIEFKAAKHAMTYEELEPEYARSGVTGYYAQVIPPLFKPFSQMPDPAKYQPLIDDLKRALHGLSNGVDNQDPIDKKDIYPANPTLTKMTTASDYLEDWTGKAAMQFKQKFLDPFPAIARNQFILTATLKSGLEAHQAMWAAARKDIDKIAHDTINVFDNQGMCDDATWEVSFTVLSSVAAVGAAILTVTTAGAAAPLVITAIGAAAQVGATTPPEGLPKTDGGGTALKIIGSMKTAIEDLTKKIQETETKITNALQQTTQMVTGSTNYFVAARPALADVPPGSVTGENGLGQSD